MSIPVPGKPYILTNVATGTVMDLSGVDNTTVIGFQNHGGDNQQVCFFAIFPHAEAEYDAPFFAVVLRRA